MDFKDYLKILYRRRLWVLVTVLASVVFYGSYVTVEPQLYRATGRMILARSDPILSIMGGVTYSPKVLSYRTQMSVARSRPVCELAAEKLARHGVSAGEIQEMIALEKEGETEIVAVHAVTPEPRAAEAIVNALIEAFTEYDRKKVTEGATNAIRYLTEQIANVNTRELPEIETALKAFRKEKRIYDLSEQIKLDLKRLGEGEAACYEIEFQIAETQTEIQEIQHEIQDFVEACKRMLAEKAHVSRQERLRELVGDGEIPPEDLLASLKERMLGEASAAPGAQRVRGIEEELAKARLARRAMLATYTESHPDIQRSDRHIVELEEMLAAALCEDNLERALRRRFSTYDRLRGKEAHLAALQEKQKRSGELVEKLRERLGKVSDAEIQYLNLSRQFSAAKERLASLMQKRSDLELESRRIEGNVSLYEQAASGSAQPLPKQSTKSWPLWLLTTVVFSVGIAYLTDLMDTTIRTDYQVSRYLNLPVLGVIPFVDERSERLLIHQPLRTSLMEEFSRLATFFPTHYQETGAKVFMVVSFNEEEGKSTTVSNLGVAFARNGYTTVLADADMRKPKLHDFFNVEIHPGFSSLLDGTLEAAEQARQIAQGSEINVPVENLLGQILAHPPDWKGEGLYLAPSGTVPENPAGLLRSENCLRFLEEVRESADVALVDVPPLIGAADALILAPWVDGVIFLVEAGVTTREEATQGKKMIENAGGRIIGCILNKAREVGSSSYYYYTRGYGYARRRYGHYGAYGSYAR